MRKILTSVLSVAGLLAVVLALAVSPATAQEADPVVILVTTDDNVGTYTVSWETRGGCDPGAGTSGASGSSSRSVAAPTPGAATGTATTISFTVDRNCRYSFESSHTNASGGACTVEYATDISIPATGGSATFTMSDIGATACATTADFVVTVRAPGPRLGDCIEDTTDTETGDDCDTGVPGDQNPDAGDVDTGTRRATADDVTRGDSWGAVQGTVFTVTATPEKGANDQVPKGCEAASAETKWDYDESRPKATLKLVDAPLGGNDDTCEYTVAAVLPAGFAPGGGEARSTANAQEDVNPGTSTAGTPTGPATVTVSIASVKVFLVQNVIGDAGNNSVSYKLTTPCGAPGLPSPLGARPNSGGINVVSQTNAVELREGRYEVTAALTDVPSTYEAGSGLERTALNNEGAACEATVAVSGVPGHCSGGGVSTGLASASGQVILEVTIDCSEPVAPDPAPEAPAMDDTDDMGADDMGADDMGADDMGADDMGADDMGADDMDGPAMDTPTG